MYDKELTIDSTPVLQLLEDVIQNSKLYINLYDTTEEHNHAHIVKRIRIDLTNKSNNLQIVYVIDTGLAKRIVRLVEYSLNSSRNAHCIKVENMIKDDVEKIKLLLQKVRNIIEDRNEEKFKQAKLVKIKKASSAIFRALNSELKNRDKEI